MCGLADVAHVKAAKSIMQNQISRHENWPLVSTHRLNRVGQQQGGDARLGGKFESTARENISGAANSNFPPKLVSAVY